MNKLIFETAISRLLVDHITQISSIFLKIKALFQKWVMNFAEKQMKQPYVAKISLDF